MQWTSRKWVIMTKFDRWRLEIGQLMDLWLIFDAFSAWQLVENGSSKVDDSSSANNLLEIHNFYREKFLKINSTLSYALLSSYLEFQGIYQLLFRTVQILAFGPSTITQGRPFSVVWTVHFHLDPRWLLALPSDIFTHILYPVNPYPRFFGTITERVFWKKNQDS